MSPNDTSYPKPPALGYPATLSLKQPFRFLHEPIPVHSRQQLIGREHDLAALVDRIFHADGGSFLVTGYRGVGKTTFVNRVLAELRDRLAGLSTPEEDHRLVDIQLNLAKPLPAIDLMFHVIRCVYSRLGELGISQHLPPAAQQQLALAYQRTSMTVKRAAADSRESGLALPDLEFEIPGGAKGKVKSPWSAKRSSSSSQESSYLAYDERAAEYDLIRLSSLLTTPIACARTWRERWLRRPVRVFRLKIVFVFDELDKLEDVAGVNGARPYLDDLFSSLKNLFTTSGLSFIFVAGKETQDRWVDDVGRGDSVYESVFAYERYLPCLWQGAQSLCDSLLASPASASAPIAPPVMSRRPTTVGELHRFLTYVGRGIPRRMLRSLNELVRFVDQQPQIALTAEELTRVEFYADLQRLLDENPAIFGYSRYEGSAIVDRRRLAVYYLIDWILRRSDRAFTVAEVAAAANSLSTQLTAALPMAEAAQQLVSVLVSWSYLERANQANQVQVLDPAKPPEARYRLTEEALRALAGWREADLPAVPVAPADPQFTTPVAPADRLPTIGSIVDAYVIRGDVGTGGMGVVYHATNSVTGKAVALKMCKSSAEQGDARLLRLFRQEIQALRTLQHPGVVKILDAGEWNGHPYFTMELIEGITLRPIVGELFATIPLALRVGQELAQTLSFVHAQGFFRNDIKPENVMIDLLGQIYLLDFGIVFREGDEDDDTVIGTVSYMAPEALSPGKPDPRMDVYALGLVLYELVCGRPPFLETDLAETQRRRFQVDFPSPASVARVAPELDRVIMKCLEPQPENRYSSMSELAQALDELVSLAGPAPEDLRDLVRARRTRQQAGREITAIPGPASPANELPGAERSVASIAISSNAPEEPSAGSETRIVSETPYVEIRGPDWPGVKRLFLQEAEVGVGRSSAASIQLADKSVSRLQAKLILRDGRYHYFDFGSKHGATLNGEPVERKVYYPLTDGAMIRFGPYQMEFHEARRRATQA